jgi:hypothetical protein
MTKAASKIRFKTKLLQPAEKKKGDDWMFLIVPKNASAKLPSRSVTPIEGTINGFAFQATLQPDGQKSHWLQVDRKLSKAARADAGDLVTLEIAPAPEDTEATVPQDLRKAWPPPLRGREKCGPTSRPMRAEIGSTGSARRNRRKRARAGSRMLVRCSRPESDAFAASIGRGSMIKASALLKLRPK